MTLEPAHGDGAGPMPAPSDPRRHPIRLAPPVWISTHDELRRFCDAWHDAAALAVDTEFVRERTFYPKLGLIQVNQGSQPALIDPVAIENLEPFNEVLQNASVLKVFHSGTEDLEVLYHRFSSFPTPIFDTQIAAALCGLGYSLGYSTLVQRLFAVELPKGETRTNWLRRPLTPEQIEYASLDVGYLVPIHGLLSERLQSRGRESWVLEEAARLANTERFLPDPDELYRSFPRIHSMSRRELAILRDLAAWRERSARARDLPRSFVLQKHLLPLLARHRPTSLQALAALRDLKPQERRRHGDQLIEVIRQAMERPAAELPYRPEQPVDTSAYRPLFKKLRAAVAETAAELDLPPELLASKKVVEKLLKRFIADPQAPLPEELCGWRETVLGRRLFAILHTPS